ncbi:MAG: hypoxanthine phosphoribosyltransferase [Eubacterium sp.]|nr:hypoxanthine phosphoribosyltransferase [Eubacterium sp.]
MEVKINTLIDQETLEKRIREMAEELDRIYAGKELRMIGILKGSVYFLCELTRHMKTPVTLDFISVSSYGNGMAPEGEIRFTKDLDESVEGQEVILIEDIMDTGRTLSYLMEVMKKKNPASLRVITLLDKPSRRVVDIEPWMTGFTIPDKFVVGYGLDYAQQYRNLPYIGTVE